MTSTPIYDALNQADLLSLLDPEQLRDEGIARTEAAADPRVILTIDLAVARMNASGKPWSANHLRVWLPVSHAPLIGARVRAAAMRRPREMVRIGYVPSDLPSTHGHPIALWQGVGL